MYDHPFHSHETAGQQDEHLSAESATEPQVIWMDEPSVEARPSGREADPFEVIDFLLAKTEEQQARIQEQAEFVELQNQEIEQLKAQIESARHELAAQLADNDILMQNTLAVEHELDLYKAKATDRPKIQLPFHAEQKLAKLGFGEEVPLDREAV